MAQDPQPARAQRHQRQPGRHHNGRRFHHHDPYRHDQPARPGDQRGDQPQLLPRHVAIFGLVGRLPDGLKLQQQHPFWGHPERVRPIARSERAAHSGGAERRGVLCFGHVTRQIDHQLHDGRLSRSGRCRPAQTSAASARADQFGGGSHVPLVAHHGSGSMKFKLNPSQKFRLQVAILALEVVFTVLMYLALHADQIVLGKILSSLLILGIFSLIFL